MIFCSFIFLVFWSLYYFYFGIKGLNTYGIATLCVMCSLVMLFLSYFNYEVYKNVLMHQKKIGKLKLFFLKTLCFIGLIITFFKLCLSCFYIDFCLYSAENFFYAFINLIFFLFILINFLGYWFNLDGKSYLAASRNGIINEDIKDNKI